MKKMRTKDKTSLLLGLGILIFCMLCVPAFATTDDNYNYEGFALTTIKSGNGDVYVSCGDNAGLAGTSYATNTFTTDFSNVPTSDIEWAELDVGVWGGAPGRVGYVYTTLNDNEDTYVLGGGTEYLDIITLPDNVLCSGSGVYLVQYDCTNAIRNLANADITANVTAWPETSLGTSRRLDSRIYGAVLTVVYNNGTSNQYWINKGDLNLHKNVTITVDNTSCSFEDFDASITQFNGSVNSSLNNSTLTVGYFAGDDTQNDYLYFNPPVESDSPYNLDNFYWEINDYVNYQLDSNNVANETCDELNSGTTNFDLHTFEVTGLNASSNCAVFWRGHGNEGDSEIFDPAYPGVNSETESYLSPFLSVLRITA